MNKYIVTVHQVIHPSSNEALFDDEREDTAVCYEETVEADCFEAGDGDDDTYGNSMRGIRFFTGSEMVAFFDHSLNISVVKQAPGE